MEKLLQTLKNYENKGWFWRLGNEMDGTYSMSITHKSWVTGVIYKPRPVPVFHGRTLEEILKRVVSALESIGDIKDG